MEPVDSGIRPIEEQDLPLVLEWRNSSRIRQWMYTDHLISWEEHVQWYKRLKDSKDKATLIYEKESIPTGVVNFTQIVPEHRRCFWGFYLGQEGLQPGTGSDMGRQALHYAFQIYSVDKICAEALDHNEASVAFHLKLGFVQEGLLRRHVIKGGQHLDVRCFALFRDQFEERNRL
jgi:UDP-4-amino-4,6-dideoxy-N-acetyl-beta-L-altrosamine N-acetyltransferase